MTQTLEHITQYSEHAGNEVQLAGHTLYLVYKNRTNHKKHSEQLYTAPKKTNIPTKCKSDCNYSDRTTVYNIKYSLHKKHYYNSLLYITDTPDARHVCKQKKYTLRIYRRFNKNFTLLLKYKIEQDNSSFRTQ